MTETMRMLLCMLTATVGTLLLEPIVIRLAARLKAGQPVLHYVDKHEGKSGTPTMGGIGFLLAATIAMLIWYPKMRSAGMAAIAFTLAYATVGFLDDFLKIRRHDNQGLHAYQKIIGQVGIAVLLTWYCMRSPYIGTQIEVPFFGLRVTLGWWYAPLCMLAAVGMSNAVNLTDGLDGLVSSTGAVFFGCMGAIAAVFLRRARYAGDVLIGDHYLSVGMFCMAILGALLGFLWFNSHPARIFMGDTGALALGGAAACAGLFLSDPLIILLPGIMYLVSCISVIMQVIAFRLTKKRIFRMAPFHHHLEYSGVKECKIVAWYTILTVIGAVVAYLSLGV